MNKYSSMILYLQVLQEQDNIWSIQEARGSEETQAPAAGVWYRGGFTHPFSAWN